MDNLRETIQVAMKNKTVTIKKMCLDINITEQTFHRGMRLNSMSMKTFRKIKEYLGMEEITIEKAEIYNQMEKTFAVANLEWSIERKSLQQKILILTNTITKLGTGNT